MANFGHGGDWQPACTLQIEEMEAEYARVHAERQEEGTAVFRGNVQAHYNMVHTYEDEMSQAVAISVMPLQLQTAALEACAVSDAMGEQPALAWDDGEHRKALLSCTRPACNSQHAASRQCQAPSTAKLPARAGLLPQWTDRALQITSCLPCCSVRTRAAAMVQEGFLHLGQQPPLRLVRLKQHSQQQRCGGKRRGGHSQGSPHRAAPLQ